MLQRMLPKSEMRPCSTQNKKRENWLLTSSLLQHDTCHVIVRVNPTVLYVRAPNVPDMPTSSGKDILIVKRLDYNPFGGSGQYTHWLPRLYVGRCRSSGQVVHRNRLSHRLCALLFDFSKRFLLVRVV